MPSLEEILKRDEQLMARPESSSSVRGKFLRGLREKIKGGKVGKFFQKGGEQVREGLVGPRSYDLPKPEFFKDENITTEMGRKGVLGFAAPFGVGKTRDVKIFDREIELARAGMDPVLAKLVAEKDVPEPVYVAGTKIQAPPEKSKDRLARLSKEFKLSKEQQNALKRVRLFEVVDKAGGALDFLGVGSVGKKGLVEVFEKIAKSEAPELIIDVVKKELPGLSDDVVNEFTERTVKETDPERISQIFDDVMSGGRKSPDEIIKGIEEPVQPIERGLYKSIQESPNVPQPLKEQVAKLPDEAKYYDIYTDKEAVAKANARILKGKDEALHYVLTSTDTGKEVATTGLELMRIYSKEGNYDMAAKLAGDLAQKATKQGQFIQAFSMLDKLSPEGWLSFAAKRLKDAPSPQLAEEIVKKAKVIQETPYGYKKFKETHELAELIDKSRPKKLAEKAKDWFFELINLPRSLASSFLDFSGSLRQALVAGVRHPKNWASAFKSQFKPFFSEKAYDEVMDYVVKHPDFQLANEAGVAFTDINLKLTAREEAFMSSWAEKIPGIGKIVRGTNRSYTALLNKLRMDTFATQIKNLEKLGLDQRKNFDLAKSTASLVNDMTGRGDMAEAFERAAPILNAVFYSPRLMASRLNLLVPIKYIGAPAPIRKEYLKTMLAFTSYVTTILGLASLHPDVEIGLDPRSADFGKIKIGNTRFDIMGGMQQYIRIFAQVISGKYVSSSTGKVITLGEGYKPLTRLQVLSRGLESKQAPIFSLLTTLLRGQTFEGEKVKPLEETGKRFIPMLASDLYEVYKEDPELLPFGILGMFGVGVQAYPKPEAYQKMEEINKSSNPVKAMQALEKENPTLAAKVKRAQRESTFNEFDWGLTYLGVENGERAQFIYERLQSLPPVEATKLRADLKEKKLISDTVDEQLRGLERKYKSPATQGGGTGTRKSPDEILAGFQ